MSAESSLFETGEHVLQGGVLYYPDFIPLKEADVLFGALMKLQWEQHDFFSTGHVPRKCLAMLSPNTSPRVPNRITRIEWAPEAERVRALVEDKVGCKFDSLTLNLYRDQRDSIDWHFDGEQDGLWRYPVASVSLGAVRRFKWRSMTGLTTIQSLAHGSLLVMPAGFQRDYRHALLKQQRACGPRINLTFRRTVDS